ncbi:hypothetical protein JP33_04600 [Gallibacterium anatis CCM5995]|nr:hypothetical protein JP33_04600 [Gallibacterium anatis CCM5995]
MNGCLNGGFFYSRKSANLPFTKILVKVQWWAEWKSERTPCTFESGKTNSVQFTTNDWSLRW